MTKSTIQPRAIKASNTQHLEIVVGFLGGYEIRAVQTFRTRDAQEAWGIASRYASKGYELLGGAAGFRELQKRMMKERGEQPKPTPKPAAALPGVGRVKPTARPRRSSNQKRQRVLHVERGYADHIVMTGGSTGRQEFRTASEALQKVKELLTMGYSIPRQEFNTLVTLARLPSREAGGIRRTRQPMR